MELDKKGNRKILLATGSVSVIYWIVPAIQYHYFDSLDIHWVFSVSEIYLFMVMVEKPPIPILVLLGSLLLTWLVLYKLAVFFVKRKQKKE
jgi:hypothetical protein